MHLTIHRGTHEIGGTCAEVTDGVTRIILDIGLPLWASAKGGRASPAPSIADLTSQGVIPDVPGLFRGDPRTPPVDAVLVSHPHLDHYGLLRHVKEDLPIYTGEVSARLMELTAAFGGTSLSTPPAFRSFRSGTSFSIGGFTITPYLMDHSAFDSYAFLIKALGKSLFYTGDFRAHGRKEAAFRWFLHKGPENVDALLMEGTMLGRVSERVETEEALQERVVQVLRRTRGVVYACLSAQNIDRTVSFWKAAVKANRIMVVDVYAANVLKTVAAGTRIPYPSNDFAGLRVMFPHGLTTRMRRMGQLDRVYPFRPYKIMKPEIAANPGRMLVLVRPSMLSDIRHIHPAVPGAVIYSMWEGYRREPRVKEFLEYLDNQGYPCYRMHTSGHAPVLTLKALARKLKPKVIIPIHTDRPEEFESVFRGVKLLCDGQPVQI